MHVLQLDYQLYSWQILSLNKWNYKPFIQIQNSRLVMIRYVTLITMETMSTIHIVQ